jgi:hypothetical protein
LRLLHAVTTAGQAWNPVTAARGIRRKGLHSAPDPVHGPASVFSSCFITHAMQIRAWATGVPGFFSAGPGGGNRLQMV